MKRPTKTAFEQDAFGGWRRFFCYMKRAGVRRKAKRQVHKRERREAKEECNHDYDHPIRHGRAHYTCRNCGGDISLDLILLHELEDEEEN